MKKIALLLLAFSLSLGLHAQKTYMLATAVSDYKGQQNDLVQTTKDAKTLAKFFKSRGATVTLLTSKYATRDNIIYSLRKIAQKMKPEDRLIFAYNGHGTEGALYTNDAGNNKPLLYSELYRELEKINCQNVTIFINACFSGSATKSIKGSKYVLFLSSRETEKSAVTNWYGGMFSRSLLKGLQNIGGSDSNGDKKITVMELFEYIRKDVMNHSDSNQHPTLGVNKANRDMVVVDWNKKKD
ncbi:MAG: caspase family protein [Prevotella sp.]|nr:caspase family protein [Prevotella sp.]